MKKLHTLLTIVFLLTAGVQTAIAQGEKESVDQFRVKSDFRTPVLNMPSDSNPDSIEQADPVAMISPDSFGVRYQASAGVFQMIQLHREVNDEIENTKGYRIQIYAGSSLEVANDAKADFLMSFDDDECPVYQLWNPPHFRVRVGDFLSRSEAMAEVSSIREIFPDAFIVADEVKVPKFKNRKRIEEDEIGDGDMDSDGFESPESPENDG